MEDLGTIYSDVSSNANNIYNLEVNRINEALANAYLDVDQMKSDAVAAVNSLPYRNATQSQFIESIIYDAESGVDPEIIRRKGLTAKVATTGNITLSGLQTIDTIPLIENDKVLVKNQTSSKYNGLYVVKPTAWVRAIEADSVLELRGIVLYIEKGSVNINTGWTATTNISVLGTSAIPFTKTSAKGVLLTSAVSYTVNTIANAYANANEILTRSEANYPLALADLDSQLASYNADLDSMYVAKCTELDLGYAKAEIDAENEICIECDPVWSAIDQLT